MSQTPYTPPPPPPPPPAGGGPAPSGSSDRGIMLFLSYFGIFALIPLLTKKEDAEVQWHAKNGLALTVAWFIVWVAFTAISFVLPLPLRLAWSGLGCVIGCVFFIADIVAMVKAIGGQRMRFPVITDYAEKM